MSAVAVAIVTERDLEQQRSPCETEKALESQHSGFRFRFLFWTAAVQPFCLESFLEMHGNASTHLRSSVVPAWCPSEMWDPSGCQRRW